MIPAPKTSIHQIIRAKVEPSHIKHPRKCPFYQHFRGSVRYSNSSPKDVPGLEMLVIPLFFV